MLSILLSPTSPQFSSNPPCSSNGVAASSPKYIKDNEAPSENGASAKPATVVPPLIAEAIA